MSFASSRGPRAEARARPPAALAGAAAILLLALGLSAGCGEPEAGVVLTIESSREVPEEIDRLLFRVEAEGFRPRDEIRDLDRPFPHTLGILVETGAAPLTITVWGVKDGAEVTSVQMHVQPVPGEVVRARLVL
jgi:hypothetical protein